MGDAGLLTDASGGEMVTPAADAGQSTSLTWQSTPLRGV